MENNKKRKRLRHKSKGRKFSKQTLTLELLRGMWLAIIYVQWQSRINVIARTFTDSLQETCVWGI